MANQLCLQLVILVVVACCLSAIIDLQVSAANERLVKIPLTKRVAGTSDRMGRRVHSMLTHRDSHKSPVYLLNYSDMEYIGQMTIGTPWQQVFSVTFSTGASDLWLPSLPPEQWICCRFYMCYNQSNSQTHKQDGRDFYDNYVTNYVTGRYGSDTIRLPDANIEVSDLLFGEIYYPPEFNYFPADGIMGLGFPQSRWPSIKGPLAAMVDQGQIDAPIFSFLMNRNRSDIDNGGQLILGGIDTDLYEGPITYINVVGNEGWHVSIGGEINFIREKDRNVTLPLGDPDDSRFKLAIVDTASSFIITPLEEALKINAIIGAVDIGYGMQGIRNCDTIDLDRLPAIALHIGHKEFVLQPKQYLIMRPFYKGHDCYSGFVGKDMASQDRPQWILGNNFIGAYYSIFDYPKRRIGFAKPVQK